ncbi:AAA family ATPase [Trichloromonas sp.]|uniref:AAA family ATPase n=1 Tax=Trichloromonas sp. TaxID=3069249 RepID=UPI002A3E88C0|nr:AAA family ATPase [Trichloromonas sp.]
MNNVLNIKILSGIPASGKSTWAKDYVYNNRNTVRINRDDLRKSIFNDFITDGNENFINNAKLSLIKTSLEFDKNIILDDTHCYKDYLIFLIDYIRNNAKQLNKNIKIIIVDFDVNVNVCVKRNFKRKGKLDKNIIYHMYKTKNEINYNSLDIDEYIKMSDSGL